MALWTPGTCTQGFILGGIQQLPTFGWAKWVKHSIYSTSFHLPPVIRYREQMCAHSESRQGSGSWEQVSGLPTCWCEHEAKLQEKPGHPCPPLFFLLGPCIKGRAISTEQSHCRGTPGAMASITLASISSTYKWPTYFSDSSGKQWKEIK